MLHIGQEIQATVEKLVFSGKGLIRYQGWVIFVEDVAPGEEVAVTISEKKKSFYLATLNKVIRKSPDRVEKPFCEYFGVCGGCQLQHLSYPAQIQAKEMWLKEALEGIAKQKINFPLNVHKAPKEWEYRRKICLHFHWDVEKFEAGYYSRDNTSLLQVQSCPIFCAKNDPVFSDVYAFLQHFKGYLGCIGDVYIMKAAQEKEKYLVRFFFRKKIPTNAQAVLDTHLQKFPKFVTVWIESPSKSLVGGSQVHEVEEAGLQVRISPRAFLQNFPEQSLKLYRDVIELISSNMQQKNSKKSVLDLYSGVGILSLLLAQDALEVYGVEFNKEAVELAKINAQLNKIENAHFIAARVEDALRGKLKNKNFPTWIVNPPREGLSEQVVNGILQFCPETVVYISCMPSTLSRDLFKLCENTYTIKKVQGYDMFPQTTHLETVVLLEKK
jgi:23S rRNA (uracil1939-C5)-methyltransferase